MDKPTFPYPPKPGGWPSLHEVIGRSEVIQHLLELLEQHSVLLLGPRRIGKTWICHWIKQAPGSGFAATCYLDVEAATSVNDFLERTKEQATNALATGIEVAIKNLASGAKKELKRLEKLSVNGIEGTLNTEADWRRELRGFLAGVEKAVDKIRTGRFLFIWDEFPLFIENLIEQGASKEAWELMLTLKAYRQENAESKIRMIFTGSIGLPEVLDRLREDGFHGKPEADLRRESIDCLSREGALDLASCLLWSLDLPDASTDNFVECVADYCDHHPAMIQYVVDELAKNRPDAFDTEAVQSAMQRVLRNPDDPFDLRHYVVRLSKLKWKEQALDILDSVARSPEEGPTREQLINLLDRDDDAAVIEQLRVLSRNGYLRKEEETGRIVFRLRFLRRYWRSQRGLE